MPKSKWPRVPSNNSGAYPAIFSTDWVAPPPDTTLCKHGAGECETCGTTNRRDFPHRTPGAVSRLFGKK